MKQYQAGDLIAGEFSVQRVFGGEGQSGMGVVYLVTSRDAPEPFILKTIQPRDDDTGLLSRFVKEAQAWISVGWHPNIARMFWAREIENVLHLAAEYIAPDELDRNTVTHYLKGAPIPLTQILRWTIQFCYAMDHAKSKGLRAHRDIKPDNLMVDNKGDLRITDFGLASLYDGRIDESYKSRGYAYGRMDMTNAGSAMGTYPYMAPEQFLDSRNVDSRADIYSFGIVLYGLVSEGRYPYPIPKRYRSSNLEEAYAEMHSNAPAEDLSSPFNSVVQKCLAKKPSDRYQSYEELIASVRAMANQLVVKLPPKPNVPEDSVEELYARAQSLCALKQVDRALESVSHYLALRPDAYWGWTEKGRIFLEKNQLPEALASTTTSISIYSENARAWNNLGIIHQRAGRYDDAVQSFEKSLTIDPANIVAMLNVVQPLIELRRYSQVTVVLRKALALCPTKTSLLSNASNAAALMLQRQYPEGAEAILKLLTGLDKDNAQNWHNRALLAQTQGRKGEAIDCFLEVERIEPTNARCLLFLARLNAEAGRYPESISYCDKLISLNAEIEAAVSFKAQMLNHAGRSRDALALLNATLSRNPNLDGLWFVVSDLHMANGNRADAVKALQACLGVLQSNGRDSSDDNVRTVQQRIRRLESVS